MSLLQASGVTKRFGGIVALKGVSFEAQAGEVHAILGENGAGKSTFIQILSGAIAPDEGTLTLRGQPFRAAGPADAARAGIAAVFQELSLVPDLTVAENIWFGREPMARWSMIHRRELLRRTERLLTELELSRIPLDRPVRHLSVAERQLVEIAKALAFDPDILILDEATSALPPHEVDWLLGIARARADAGKLVLYISHRLAEVRRVAERVTVLRNGETVGTRTTATLSDDEIVTMMLGRQLERLYPERRTTSTERPALQVDGLAVGHRLKGADLVVHEGEILGVAGLQGHGQRELFLALFGALRARGQIRVWGKSVTIRDPHHALSAGIGMALLPEDRRMQGLLLSKSVRENLILAVLPRLVRRGLLDLRREAAQTADAIRRLQVKVHTPEQLAGTLSGGNQQKVVLAKLLLTQARILLFYDPTRGVDVGTKAEIFALMRELAAQGYAILFYSTDLPELTHVSDRVAVMSYGRIATVLEGEAISEEAILHATLTEREAA
jgi:ribose transport system ATP-binding protein